MKDWNYFHLALVNLRAMGKRIILLLIAMALLLSVVMALYMLIAGAQDTSYSIINSPTDGKVLVATMPDNNFCEGQCSSEDHQAQIMQNIQQYQGQVIKNVGFHKVTNEATTTIQVDEITFEGMYPVLPADVLSGAIEYDLAQVPENSIPILLPLNVAAEWTGVDIPAYSAQQPLTKAEIAQEVLNTSNRLRETLLGTEVVSPNNEYYFVVGFLPSNVGRMPLRFSSVGQEGNWLDIIFPENLSQPSNPIIVMKEKMPADFSIEKGNVMMSLFPDMQSAREYKENPVNMCDPFERGKGRCPETYHYAVSQYFGGSLNSRFAPERVYDFLNPIVFFILAISAVFFICKLTKTTKAKKQTLAGYRQEGITKRQLLGVEFLSFVIIMLAVMVTSILFSLLWVLIINLVESQAISQLFSLVFGIRCQQIWLLGWSAILFLPLIYGAAVLLVGVIISLIKLRKIYQS